jgi:hypothetical protein
MSTFLLRVLTPLVFLSASPGCTKLWGPFTYPDPNNCAQDPAICGAGFQCNFQREVCEPAMAPTITGIAPASLVNTGGRLTITGSGFLSGATVSVGGLGCDSPTVTATAITCTAPALATRCGKQTVVVNNPNGQAATDSKSLSYRSATFGFAPVVNLTVGAGANCIVAGDVNGN